MLFSWIIILHLIKCYILVPKNRSVEQRQYVRKFSQLHNFETPRTKGNDYTRFLRCRNTEDRKVTYDHWKQNSVVTLLTNWDVVEAPVNSQESSKIERIFNVLVWAVLGDHSVAFCYCIAVLRPIDWTK